MPPVKPRGVRVSGFRVGWKGFARGLKVFGGFNLGFRIVVLGLRLAYKLGVSGSAVQRVSVEVLDHEKPT